MAAMKFTLIMMIFMHTFLWHECHGNTWCMFQPLDSTDPEFWDNTRYNMTILVCHDVGENGVNFDEDLIRRSRNRNSDTYETVTLLRIHSYVPLVIKIDLLKLFPNLERLQFPGQNFRELPTLTISKDEFRNTPKLNDFRVFEYTLPSDFTVTSAPNLKVLYIKMTSLNRVTKSLFGNAGSKLEELNLSYNKITSIEAGSFSSMVKVNEISLTVNELRTLPDGLFALSNLTKLDLSNNQIEILKRGAFQGAANLQELGIGGNKIRSIEAGAFDDLRNLKKLSASHNEITGFPDNLFANMQSLSRLSLNNNNITKITARTFKGLRNLEVLDITFNQIDEIESNAFDDLVNLQRLVLSKNRLTSLSNGLFNQNKKLKEIVVDAYRQRDDIVCKIPNFSKANFSHVENFHEFGFIYAT